MRAAVEVRRRLVNMTGSELLETVGLDATLPALSGTPRQVEWAESIRCGCLYGAAREVTSGDWDGPEEARILAGMAAMARQSDAKWWINRREHGEDGLGLALRLGE